LVTEGGLEPRYPAHLLETGMHALTVGRVIRPVNPPCLVPNRRHQSALIRCLDDLAFPRRVFGRSSKRDLIERAYQAWDAEDWQSAEESLESAARRDPDGRGSEKLWFDAALAFKFLRDWRKAYELGKEAAARAPRNEQDPAFWNLGIAATVVGDWSTARDAWSGYGIELPPGDGEIVADLGMTRYGSALPTDRRWCGPTGCVRRGRGYSPCRRPRSTIRRGSAARRRTQRRAIVNGRRYPVFDELMPFTPSDLATLAVTVTGSTAGDVEALLGVFQEVNLGAELLSSGELLCRCCSEGSRTLGRAVEGGRQTVFIAASEARAAELLDRWPFRRHEHRDWEGLHRATRSAQHG
jgi:hypothetical protein